MNIKLLTIFFLLISYVQCRKKDNGDNLAVANKKDEENGGTVVSGGRGLEEEEEEEDEEEEKEEEEEDDDDKDDDDSSEADLKKNDRINPQKTKIFLEEKRKERIAKLHIRRERF